MPTAKGFRDLKVYQLAFQLAMEIFKESKHFPDADGEATETQVWLDLATACEYLSEKRRLELLAGYEEVGRMLGGMIAHPEKFS